MAQFTLIKPVLKVCSLVLLVFGLLMTVPLLMAVIYHTGNAAAFSSAVALTVGLAAGGWLLSRSHRINMLNPRQMFLITTSSWLLISFTGALPFLFIPEFCSVTDAVFESVSGLTTTGSTAFTGLDTMAHDILVWRSMLQWVGGLGVIGMAVAILPFLKVGGMRLFQTESSDWSDKAMPRSRTMVTMIIYVYILLTFLCTLAYIFTGMDSFHAVNHAMTTISTGGYSTSDSSFAQFSDLGSHWVAISFMILGALPFAIYVHFLVKHHWQVFNDQQIRGFFLTIFLMSLVITLHLMSEQGIDLLHAMTYATFNLVSVITTTGYASGDYSQWGPLAVAAFFFAMFIGGCSGSTSGGIKIFRFQLLFMMMRESIIRAVHPRAMIRRYYNGRRVDDTIVLSAVTFIFIMLLSLVLITLLLAFSGLDFVTSLTGAATALTNVGPGLGDIIGPAGNFATLPESSKWILSLGMLLGRLEFMTILLIFTPTYWKG
ncbi:Trk system potassium uptake protein TrkI [Zhongshania aliphaticivorans]|uniref:Trk system potassium uptake protein n=2 Tax=Zhongshania aliphaticivorans TaxID=1470434 RepID=A0A5S9PJ88_9GAMM|nr:TrkH family potassium uptake protein [Zhongshania aliphaticivorans]CAA0103746.1 Trk system potassium uptake protein TrkI [Zhongshania aliphaticivorans]